MLRPFDGDTSLQTDEGTPEEIGTHENRIVVIDNHSAFVSALFNRSQAGIAERRRAVRLFTTNYDTLLEDALALGGFSYWDGFSGGAVAYRSHRYGDEEPNLRDRAHVIKLHGSIDWHLGEDDRVWRVRDGDLYPKKISRVLIYPQSTKYLATQRDPFAAQFDLFRRSLGAREENVLATCGYSFGDEHINQEIELALQRPENKTTVLAFAPKLNPTLERWRTGPWGKRVYVISEDGLYVGADGPHSPPTAGAETRLVDVCWRHQNAKQRSGGVCAMNTFDLISDLKIGHIVEVSGTTIRVELSGDVTELTRTYEGRVYPIGQIGSIVKVHFGRRLVFGL